MLAAKRQQQILEALGAQGTVRTMELAAQFGVADETIRRDFQVLAEKRQLTRIHGGASSPSGRPSLQSFTERRGRQVAAKEAIAKEALGLITPGQTYAFDSSTTAMALIAQVPDLPYRVVTNACAVIDHLIRMEHVEVISTGGRYRPKTHTFVGGDSIETLRRHNINTAFISCVGLDPLRGISEGFEQQAVFKERLVQYAEKVVLLMDATKFNQRSEYFFAGLDQVSLIITDGAADQAAVAEIQAAGVEVVVCGGL